MLKILVTGGLGSIGSTLVPELRKRGHNVLVCDMAHSAAANYIRCDISQYRQLSQVFEDHNFDYVYHLAAEFGRWNGEDYYENLWLTNAVGTKNLIRLQEKYNFRMIFSSSSEVYGDYRAVMREDLLDSVAIRQLNDYAISKRVNEMQIMNSRDRYRTETVIVRLFNTYGPGEYYSKYRSANCIFVYRALHNLPYTVYTAHIRTSSYVDDTVRTLANISGNFKPGEIYNIGGAESHTMKELSDIVLECLGMDDSLVEYHSLEPATTLKKKVDTSKAVRDLKRQNTVSLREGIARTIEWQKEVYGLG